MCTCANTERKRQTDRRREGWTKRDSIFSLNRQESAEKTDQAPQPQKVAQESPVLRDSARFWHGKNQVCCLALIQEFAHSKRDILSAWEKENKQNSSERPEPV